MKARVLLAGCLVAAAVGLSACGSNLPATGTVIAKSYQPAHAYTWLMPISIGKSVMFVPETGYRPAEWELKLRACDQATRPNLCRTGWRQVDETTYHAFALGETYP